MAGFGTKMLIIIEIEKKKLSPDFKKAATDNVRK